ncbi:TonB-dependent receptor domain-containing protein [Melittangium boletus]|uniref:TonB-dependent receptor domain-containing protein n=1 Tax=Melittangium boletus TaxID=83453 RepID=UPI003DA4A696
MDPSRQSTSGSDLDSYRYSGRGEWKASERWRLEAKAEGNRKVQRGVDALTTGAVIDRASQDEALLVTLLPTWELSARTTLSFTAHYSRFRHRFVYDQRGGAALDRIDETLEQLAKVGAQLNQHLGASHQLVAGAEGLTELLASDRLSGGRGRRSRLSLFAQDVGYDNIARARVRGVEVGWNQRLPASLLVELGYTFTQARDLSEDRALPGQAAHRLTARASWRYRPWGLEASVRGGVVGARPYFEDAEGDGVEETVRAPRYVTVDAQLSKSLGEAVKLFVAGNNLAGAGDARLLPIPPRALYAGVSARF